MKTEEGCLRDKETIKARARKVVEMFVDTKESRPYDSLCEDEKLAYFLMWYETMVEVCGAPRLLEDLAEVHQ